MCARERGSWELAWGGWEKGGIRYEWNALRPHFSEDHLLCLHPPLLRRHAFILLLSFLFRSLFFPHRLSLFLFSLMSLSLVTSTLLLSPSLFLSSPDASPFRALVNLAYTYVYRSVFAYCGIARLISRRGSSIPEPKFKGDAAPVCPVLLDVKASYFTYTIFYTTASVPTPEPGRSRTPDNTPDFPPFAFALCSISVPLPHNFSLCSIYMRLCARASHTPFDSLPPS